MNQKTKEFLDRNEKLNSSLIGFEFEFYSKHGFNFIAEDLSRVLGKDVKVSYKNKADGKIKRVRINDETNKVSYSKYKLEHDFSGGKSMIELITGPTPYYESKIILAKVLDWIKKNGRTSDKCGLHINISFDKFNTPSKKIEITSLDVLKFILNFDEDIIFSKFPFRKDNVFARSIDYIFPTNKFSFTDDIKTINRSSFTVPKQKYFGVNFGKLDNGYLEFRYLGGKNYEERLGDILPIMDYMIESIFECLLNSNYTQENLLKLRTRLQEHKKFVNSISSFNLFRVFYKMIHLYIDLKQDEQTLTTYWPEYREALFDMIYVNGLKSGYINLDLDLHKYQIKDGAFIKPFSLVSYDLVDCSIKNSIIEECTLIGCSVKSSNILYSEISMANKIENSKIHSCPIKTDDNEFINTYIDNFPHNIKGSLLGCIVRSGSLSDQSRIDNKTIVVDSKK